VRINIKLGRQRLVSVRASLMSAAKTELSVCLGRRPIESRARTRHTQKPRKEIWARNKFLLHSERKFRSLESFGTEKLKVTHLWVFESSRVPRLAHEQFELLPARSVSVLVAVEAVQRQSVFVGVIHVLLFRLKRSKLYKITL